MKACHEAIIDPQMPIVDAHHHLFYLRESDVLALERADVGASRPLAPTFRRHARYLFDEFLADISSGHNVVASVYVDADAMYRSSGPDEMKSVGEIEFANGVAAMSASGLFGCSMICAAIVGNVDLRLGDSVASILEAHLLAAGARYRGVRCGSLMAWDEDPSVLGAIGVAGVPHLLMDSDFRAGFKWLQRLGLSFDAWLLEPQLPELIDLAWAFPETTIVLDHLGAPVGVGRYEGQREARFTVWRENIRSLAALPNVTVKLGGLGMPSTGFQSYLMFPNVSSSQLANEWRPYIECCIEEFGTDRCMFESNFPVDAATCHYAVLWNTFKRLVAGASLDEKAALFSRTASRVYRLAVA